MLLSDFHQAEEARSQTWRRRWGSRLALSLILIIIALIGLGAYQLYKPLPLELDVASPVYVVNENQLNFNFQSKPEQLFDYIEQAQQYILLDLAWFNDWAGDFQLTLAERLLAKKAAYPDLKIDLLVDPSSLGYQSFSVPILVRLSDAGINLIVTDQAALPAANALSGALWLAFSSWLDWLPSYGWLANPLQSSAPRFTLRSYLAHWHFNPSQRQLMIADYQGSLISLVGLSLSSNNDASFVSVTGPIAQELYRAEAALAKLSSYSLYSLPVNLLGQSTTESNRYAQVQLLTESQLKKSLLAKLNALVAGDSVRLSTPILTDHQLIEALLGAAQRGVKSELILERNSPNLATAHRLANTDNLAIRLTPDHLPGSLILLDANADAQLAVFNTAAQLSRRHLDGFTLNSSLMITLNSQWSLAPKVNDYFKQLELGSQAYQASDVLPTWQRWLIDWQELSGFGAF